MRNLILLGTFLVVVAVGLAQTPSRIFTSPKLPARDALERMNLVVAWHARVKVEGNRDGLFSVQVIPGKPNNQVVVQTYAGAVYLYDAENGDLVWQTRVGIPYWALQPVAYNSQSIFTTRRNVLHVINRTTGAQRVFTVDQRTKQATFGFEMDYAPSAMPTADEDSLYVPMADRVQTFEIPDFEARARLKAFLEKKGKENKEDKPPIPQPDEPMAPPTDDSPQPELYWGYRLALGTTEVPLLVDGYQVSILTTAGDLIRVNRFDRGSRLEFVDFQTGGRVASAAGQYANMAYIGCDDFNVYAIDLTRSTLIWRHVSGAAIRHKPEVNDDAVYIAPERVGLRRLKRETGREVWTNRDASRFLASTNHNVYALDRVGNFYVVDARRGTTLAKYNLSDWIIPVPNDWTDRIYLAAHDGQILCLRNRDQIKPLAMKTVDEPKKEDKKMPKKEEKKEEPKEEKKEDKAARIPLSSAPVLARLDALRRLAERRADDDRRTWAGP